VNLGGRVSVRGLQRVWAIRVFFVGRECVVVPVLAGVPPVADSGPAFYDRAQVAGHEHHPVDVKTKQLAASFDVGTHVLPLGLNVLDHLRTRRKRQGDLDGCFTFTGG